jgi:hypothetical protein
MTLQYICFLIFGICLYAIITDPNVARAFDYVLQLAKSKINHHVWWMKNDPSNPIVKYMIYRKNLKLAKELKAKIDNYYKENK